MSAARSRIDDLRTLPALADLDVEALEWLAQTAEWLEFEPGSVIFPEGQTADFMLMIVEGSVEVRRSAGNELIFLAVAPTFGAKLPFSRMTTFPGTGRAVGRTRLARVAAAVFPEMLARLPALEARLVTVLVDRAGAVSRNEEQREKLVALGRLSAGLAHELNNPAAAARRAASQLRDRVHAERGLAAGLAALPQAGLATLESVRRAAPGLVGAADLDPLARADREDELTEWLAERGVPGAWAIAADLVGAGFDTDRLEPLAESLPSEALGDAVAWLAATATVDAMISQVEEATARVSDLVGAVKTYTHMDQARESEVDVHDGLESTLTMLGHKLRGVRIERAYDRTLPRITANAGELNQVWTNLLDNAADVLKGTGQLRLSTRRDGERIVVEVGDDGPGVPPELQARIFDAFFTTKGPGQGTGLGLELARRVVTAHGGELRLESQPGNTRFTASLPLK